MGRGLLRRPRDDREESNRRPSGNPGSTLPMDYSEQLKDFFRHGKGRHCLYDSDRKSFAVRGAVAAKDTECMVHSGLAVD